MIRGLSWFLERVIMISTYLCSFNDNIYRWVIYGVIYGGISFVSIFFRFLFS